MTQDNQLRRTVSVVALAAGGLLAALELLRISFRNSQLFSPTREPIRTWDPASYGLDPTLVQERFFETEDGEVLHGWYCRAVRPIASVLYCHGNAGNLTHFAPMIPHILQGGVNVFIFDYRGFGRSSGSPYVEGVVTDAEAAAIEHDKLRPAGVPSILYGYSLGGAIAGQLIQRHDFDGLVLQSTFTNLTEMTRIAFPNIPLHHVAGRDFDTVSALGSVEIPTVILHGRDDEVVPCWMGETLYEACSGWRQLRLIDGGLHKNLYEIAPEEVIREVLALALEIKGITVRHRDSFKRRHSPMRKFGRAVRRALRPVIRFASRTSHLDPVALAAAK